MTDIIQNNSLLAVDKQLQPQEYDEYDYVDHDYLINNLWISKSFTCAQRSHLTAENPY